MKSLLDKFRRGLQRTKTMIARNLRGIVSPNQQWTRETYEDLEAALIGADLGVRVAGRLLDDIRDRYERGLIKTEEDIIAVARADVLQVLSREHPPMIANADGPTILLMVGVNGSGKTTSTGKLAYQWQQDGHSVMLAACDTFRAAAVEQLKIWGERLNCPVVAAKTGADPASVAYDAVASAVARKVDYLLVDTAGRQHNRAGLMAELAKIERTVGRGCTGAPHEVLLVLDGSSGGNAVIQAREFSRLTRVSGLVITKLDGSSKGGAVVAITEELGLPIRFVGLGEEKEDLQPFDSQMFADALFD